MSSFTLGAFGCLTAALLFVIVSEPCRHWFLVPVTLCGILVAPDAVDWLRGRLSLFDPAGVLGLFGIHFFFLAPLLHVVWDYWLEYVEHPDDWRTWLGWMAVLNATGLVLYRAARRVTEDCAGPVRARTVWRINRGWFYPLVLLALAGTAALQAWVYRQAGGIMGYIETATDVENRLTNMRGMGMVFMFSESFPILAMMAFTVYASGKPWLRSWLVLVPVLVIFVILQLLFGGLRGSRSNTVWALFWAAGMIHFWLRPITFRMVAFGLVGLILFMYVYGLYKSVGLDALTVVGDSARQAELAEKTGRTFDALLLSDLGRSDVQAYLFYQMMRPDSDYEYAWGRTYVGAFALLIPSAIWPDRPPTKVKEGTDGQFGRGSFIPIAWESSKVYGMSGETMLNFGPALVPFVFLPFGFCVAWTSRLLRSPRGDARLLLYPFGSLFCFIILVSDVDNILFNLIKNLTAPVMILVLGSDRVTLPGKEVAA